MENQYLGESIGASIGLYIWGSYRKYGKLDLLYVACFMGNFMENILKRDFQNGDSILLLHGAPVKSNCDGLKPDFNLTNGIILKPLY